MNPQIRLLSLSLPLLWLAASAGAADADADGTTALHRAVYYEDLDAVKRQLREGADPNATNRYGVMPLSLACQNGNAEIVELLLEAGANPNAVLRGGETVLMTAARTGKVAPVKSLLARGARVDAVERKGQTALMWAAAEGHAEVVAALIEAGADPKRTLDSGFSPMMFAARNGHAKVASVLLKAGVDVGAVIGTGKASGKAPPRGTSALRLAVENGHFELAVQLLEAGANPDDQRSGYAPLHVLTWVRKPHRGDGDDGLPAPRGSGKLTSLEFARVLVEKFGGKVDVRVQNGTAGGAKFGTRNATPFLLAARRADLAYLKLLRELGANATITNADGTTALLAAAGVGSRAPEEEAGTEADRLETLPWLLELGLDINAVNRRGETAMHGAAYKNVPRVAVWLAENGADIEIWNMKNKRGWTPLLIAQGFRPGNFKPDFATIDSIAEIMRAAGVEPPPAPKRPLVGKPKKYEP